jgi:hypothetical protein
LIETPVFHRLSCGISESGNKSYSDRFDAPRTIAYP